MDVIEDNAEASYMRRITLKPIKPYKVQQESFDFLLLKPPTPALKEPRPRQNSPPYYSSRLTTTITAAEFSEVPKIE
jgi:hypothetical protein